MTAVAITVNGRFRRQRLTGVQRFAAEMTWALQRLAPERVRVAEAEGWPARLPGQVWEQACLPGEAGDGVLLSLGNLAPVSVRRQVVVIHDAGVFATPEAYARPFRMWYKTVQRVLAWRGAKLVTVSAFSRSEIARHLGVPAAAIGLIPEGADHMDRIDADPGALAALGLEAGRYVLAVGTLAKHKNLGALALLAERLAARGTPLAVTGAFGAAAFSGPAAGGEPPLLPPAARYLGRVDDAGLKALYGNAGCFVFPSLYEGFGLPAVEAMACGCPVVAAAIPALQETCGDAALYADPHSPEDFAAQVTGLLQDDALRARLRAAGAARARALTWARAARLLLDIIDAPAGATG